MIDDYYDRKMQLAQAIAPRRGLMRQPLQMGAMAQPIPNQNMQIEQALQQINEQNMQTAMQDPGTSKQELAKALAGRGFTPAQDWFGVASNALEGYNMGKAQKEAKDEIEAKKKYESDARQKLAEAYASGNFAEIVKNPLLSAGDIVNLYKSQQVSQNPFGKSLTGQLAQDNYTKLVASGMDPEMAKSTAIQQAINQVAVQQGSAVPSNFGNTPRQPQVPMQQTSMVPPPLPPSDILVEDLPNIPDNGMVPTPTVAPTSAPQPPMTGVPYVDKINLQNWADINKETGKANLDVSKDVIKKSIEDADNAIPGTSIVNEMGMNLTSIGDTNSLSGLSQFVSRNWNALGLPLDEETAKTLGSQEATDSTKGELLSRIIKDYGAGTGISNTDLLSAEKRLPGITNTPLGNRLILANIARGFLAKLERSEAALSKGQFKDNPDVQQRLAQVRNALSSFNRDLALPVVINEDHAAELIKSGMIKPGSEVILGTFNGQMVPFSQMRKVKIKAE